MSSKHNDWLEMRAEYGIPHCDGCQKFLNDIEVLVVSGQPCCSYCGEELNFISDETQDALDHLNSEQQGWWHQQNNDDEWIEEVTNE